MIVRANVCRSSVRAGGFLFRRNQVSLFEIFLLAVGLSMDAFAVSLCKGLAAKKAGIRECLICGIWFGIFQGLMPFIGYLISSWFEKWISIVAPWVAFILLSIIGINMIREAFSEEEEASAEFGVKTMFLLAVATSIDALAVGITFVAVPIEIIPGSHLVNTAFVCVLITITTFIISAFGVKIGHLFGMRYKSGSEVMGGLILVFIGLRALLGSLDQSAALSDTGAVFLMLIPLIGTVSGAAFVYIRKFHLSSGMRRILSVASACIMFFISAWGLIGLGIKDSDKSGLWKILSLILSVCAGFAIQAIINRLVPHTHASSGLTEGMNSNLPPEAKLMLSEIIHHLPEGVAFGSIIAGHLMEASWIPFSAALILSIGIALQSFPEALFISLPIAEHSSDTGKAFFIGTLSGIPIPFLGVLTMVIVLLFPVILPYAISAATGAIIFTASEEMRKATKNV